jgi:hypothetical protein
MLLDREVFGDLRSRYLPLVLISQSYGDRVLLALKGERIVEVALRGESAPENAGEGGIRRRPRRAVDGAEEDGKTN